MWDGMDGMEAPSPDGMGCVTTLFLHAVGGKATCGADSAGFSKLKHVHRAAKAPIPAGEIYKLSKHAQSNHT